MHSAAHLIHKKCVHMIKKIEEEESIGIAVPFPTVWDEEPQQVKREIIPDYYYYYYSYIYMKIKRPSQGGGRLCVLGLVRRHEAQRRVLERILEWRNGKTRRRMAALRICRFLRDAICNLQSSTCCLWQVAGRGALGHGDVVGLP